MCGAPVVFEISNLSLCCKTTPITSIKFECFSVVCVCFICVLKKPLWSPEDWLSLIIMVLVTFEWQWWTQGRRESLAHCRNQQVVFLLIFFFFLALNMVFSGFITRLDILRYLMRCLRILVIGGNEHIEIVLFKEQWYLLLNLNLVERKISFASLWGVKHYVCYHWLCHESHPEKNTVFVFRYLK